MAPMRPQPITHDSFSEAEAMRIMRGPTGGLAPKPAGDTREVRAVLARTIEDEVIPRLLQARQHQQSTGAASPCADEGAQAGEDHVGQLVRLLLGGSQAQAVAYIENLQVCGAGTDALMLDLLTRTARRLGEMWEEDVCDFTDVTIGVLRLNEMMRLICAAFDDESLPAQNAPSALLLQAPGEKHGLGLAMVVHFFRRAGWNVRCEPSVPPDDLMSLVGQNWFGVIGISASSSDHIGSLASFIESIRGASRNRSVAVMVGGPPFIKHPQLAAMVGADATAPDARAAVQQATIMLAQRRQQPPALDR